MMVIGDPGDDLRQFAWRAKYWYADEHNNTNWFNNTNENFEFPVSGDGLTGDPRGIRLRFLIQHIGLGIKTENFVLRKALNFSSIYTIVNFASATTRLIENRVLVQNDPTTDFFGRLGTGTYVAANTGQVEFIPNSTGMISFTGIQEVELEFSIFPKQVDLADFDIVQYRVYLTGNISLQFYGQTPTITMRKILGSPPAQEALDFSAVSKRSVCVDFGSKPAIEIGMKSNPAILMDSISNPSVITAIRGEPAVIVSPEIH